LREKGESKKRPQYYVVQIFPKSPTDRDELSAATPSVPPDTFNLSPSTNDHHGLELVQDFVNDAGVELTSRLQVLVYTPIGVA
jgi:hypothetical protein